MVTDRFQMAHTNLKQLKSSFSHTSHTRIAFALCCFSSLNCLPSACQLSDLSLKQPSFRSQSKQTQRTACFCALFACTRECVCQQGVNVNINMHSTGLSDSCEGYKEFSYDFLKLLKFYFPKCESFTYDKSCTLILTFSFNTYIINGWQPYSYNILHLNQLLCIVVNLKPLQNVLLLKVYFKIKNIS